MSIQGIFNTEVTKQTSIWVAGRLGTAVGPGSLRGCLAYDRPGEYRGPLEDRSQVRAFRRRYRSFYHHYSDQGNGGLGTGRAAMLIVLAQLTVSYVAELAGLFGVEKTAL